MRPPRLFPLAKGSRPAAGSTAMPRWSGSRWHVSGYVWMAGVPAAVLAAWTAVQAMASDPDVITLSIVGTTDVHGRVFVDEQGRGGLPLLGGFVKNLRKAREADGGAVMLLDAGDTFQGGIESNLSEGGLAVDAYNAL